MMWFSLFIGLYLWAFQVTCQVKLSTKGLGSSILLSKGIRNFPPSNVFENPGIRSLSMNSSLEYQCYQNCDVSILHGFPYFFY